MENSCFCRGCGADTTDHPLQAIANPRISDILNVIDSELFVLGRELALIAETHNRDNEWLSNQEKSEPT